MTKRWLQIHIRMMNASPITTVVENATQSLAQKPVEAQVRARVGSCPDPDPAPGPGPGPSPDPSPGRGPDPNPNCT